MSFYKKNFNINKKRGMTYVELIVVLSIFSVMSGVVIYNYGFFQSHVDVKSLGTDIALKIVEAQKSSLSGSLKAIFDPGVKPSYGVYFNISLAKGGAGSNKSFIYFADINGDGQYGGAGETLETISVPKNDIISEVDSCTTSESDCTQISPLSITFSRPSSSAILYAGSAQLTNISNVKIIVASPNNTATTTIKVYPSGRIQVN